MSTIPFTPVLWQSARIFPTSDSHSFDEQIHAMNENTGGNVGDITSEVEMVEKLQNQEICLTIRPEHQDEHHINYCISKRTDIQEKVCARSRPRIQEDQCRQRCDDHAG